MDGLISEGLAREVALQLQRMNRGYWTNLYSEILDDGDGFGDGFLVRIGTNDEQNSEENITVICWILRSVLATLLPSKPDKLTWVGAIVHGGPLNHVGGVCGGMGDDWRTLGTHGGIDDEEAWKKMFGPDIGST